MSSYAQYQQHNPFRAPDWRSARVFELLDAQPTALRPNRRRDDQYVRAYYRFVTRYEAQADQYARMTLFNADPALYYAHEMYMHSDVEWRAILEGFLLTNESYEEIGQRISVTPFALDWYERLFFHVRDRLNSPVWVSKAILGLCDGESDSRAPTPDGTASLPQRLMLYRLFGYYGGPEVLSVVATGHKRATDMPRTSAEVSSWFDETFKLLLRSRAAQAAQLLTVNKYNVMELMRMHMDVIAADVANGNQVKEEFEKGMHAFLERIPWSVARQGAKDLEGQAQQYAMTAVEPTWEEQLMLRDDQTPQQLALAQQQYNRVQLDQSPAADTEPGDAADGA